MSCEDCKKIDEERKIIYYRWGKARIGIVACEEHAREILIALDEAQIETNKAKAFRELIKDPKKNESN